MTPRSSNVWYVIDTRTNEIINDVTSEERPDISKWSMRKHIRLDLHPTPTQLENYEFWLRAGRD